MICLNHKSCGSYNSQYYYLNRKWRRLAYDWYGKDEPTHSSRLPLAGIFVYKLSSLIITPQMLFSWSTAMSSLCSCLFNYDNLFNWYSDIVRVLNRYLRQSSWPTAFIRDDAVFKTLKKIKSYLDSYCQSTSVWANENQYK